MRKLLIAAAFSAAFMSGAQALEQGGTVLSVDEASKTFTCHWGVMDKTYKTTEKTVIRVGAIERPKLSVVMSRACGRSRCARAPPGSAPA
jgi:hypothetical protein